MGKRKTVTETVTEEKKGGIIPADDPPVFMRDVQFEDVSWSDLRRELNDFINLGRHWKLESKKSALMRAKKFPERKSEQVAEDVQAEGPIILWRDQFDEEQMLLASKFCQNPPWVIVRGLRDEKLTTEFVLAWGRISRCAGILEARLAGKGDGLDHLRDSIRGRMKVSKDRHKKYAALWISDWLERLDAGGGAHRNRGNALLNARIAFSKLVRKKSNDKSLTEEARDFFRAFTGDSTKGIKTNKSGLRANYHQHLSRKEIGRIVSKLTNSEKRILRTQGS
ncbi:MAG: hypothetical protein FJX42_05610 [Alphaproteobacteria bacterium]|nr:hypothetical protein [Alphaproteobacteria bacterium]